MTKADDGIGGAEMKRKSLRRWVFWIFLWTGFSFWSFKTVKEFQAYWKQSFPRRVTVSKFRAFSWLLMLECFRGISQHYCLFIRCWKLCFLWLFVWLLVSAYARIYTVVFKKKFLAAPTLISNRHHVVSNMRGIPVDHAVVFNGGNWALWRHVVRM